MEFWERAKAESRLCSARSVGEQHDWEFLFIGALLEYLGGPVQVFTKDDAGFREALRGETVLSEVDATANGDGNGMI